MTESNLTKKRFIRAYGYREIESIEVEKAMQGSGSRKLTYVFIYTQAAVCVNRKWSETINPQVCLPPSD